MDLSSPPDNDDHTYASQGQITNQRIAKEERSRREEGDPDKSDYREKNTLKGISTFNNDSIQDSDIPQQSFTPDKKIKGKQLESDFDDIPMDFNTITVEIDPSKEQYNPNRVPPRVDWAIRHGKASMIGTPTLGRIGGGMANDHVTVCPCCGKTSVQSPTSYFS